MTFVPRTNLKGPTGTIDTATAVLLPTGSDPVVTLGGTPAHRSMEFGIPRGERGAPGDGGATSDATIAGALSPTGTSQTKTAADKLYARDLSVMAFGAVGDGATDDTAAWIAARDIAGPKGTVYFPAKKGAASTTYYFAGTTAFDLGGTNVRTDPGVIISLNSTAFVNARGWSLRNDVTIYQRDVLATVVVPANARKLNPDVSLPLVVSPDKSTVQALDFTTWSKRAYSSAAGQALGASVAGSISATARVASFTGTPNTALIQGIYTGGIAVGDEVSIRASQPTSTALGYLYAQVNLSDGSYLLWVLPDSSPAGSGLRQKVLRQRKTSAAAAVTEKTIDLPDVAYGPSGVSHPMIAIRAVSARRFELYVNGLRIDVADTALDVADIGFASAGTGYPQQSGAAFVDPIKRTGLTSKSGRVLRIAALGDSNTFGATATQNYLDFLPATLRAYSGILDVVVTNFAHSGDQAAQTLAIANANSFAGYDYVLVMIGTNDSNSAVSQAAYEANVTSIGQKIVADGSKPLFGLFPMFAYRTPGVASGPTRGQYAQTAYLRHALLYVCAVNGWPLADVQTELGPVSSNPDAMPQMFDGLHFNVLGNLAAAKAFAAKLLALFGA